MPLSLRVLTVAAPRPIHDFPWFAPVAAIFVLALLGQDAAWPEDDKSKPPSESTRACHDCGVVRSIREVRTERTLSRPDIYTTSPQYLDTRPYEPPRIGPVFSLSWGAGKETQAHVGAVGSPQMQQHYTDISYDIIVRFDDGRFGLIEQQDTDDIRVGDRIQVVDKKVQRLKQ